VAPRIGEDKAVGTWGDQLVYRAGQMWMILVGVTALAPVITLLAVLAFTDWLEEQWRRFTS
jgi:hypothetical protein